MMYLYILGMGSVKGTIHLSEDLVFQTLISENTRSTSKSQNTIYNIEIYLGTLDNYLRYLNASIIWYLGHTNLI